jgi:hypothetical protein
VKRNRHKRATRGRMPPPDPVTALRDYAIKLHDKGDGHGADWARVVETAFRVWFLCLDERAQTVARRVHDGAYNRLAGSPDSKRSTRLIGRKRRRPGQCRTKYGFRVGSLIGAAPRLRIRVGHYAPPLTCSPTSCTEQPGTKRARRVTAVQGQARGLSVTDPLRPCKWPCRRKRPPGGALIASGSTRAFLNRLTISTRQPDCVSR